jgi:hypothetical protein
MDSITNTPRINTEILNWGASGCINLSIYIQVYDCTNCLIFERVGVEKLLYHVVILPKNYQQNITCAVKSRSSAPALPKIKGQINHCKACASYFTRMLEIRLEDARTNGSMWSTIHFEC